MAASLAELEYRVRPCGKIGAYLFEQLEEYTRKPESVADAFRTGESWVLGDNPAVGLILYEDRFDYDWVQAPQITGDSQYVQAGLQRPIRVYKRVDSRLIP